jgi:hydrogenase maturation factor
MRRICCLSAVLALMLGAGGSALAQSGNSLLVHVGYAYSGLSENEFQKVRSADGQDLFSRVNQQESSDDFILGFALQSRPIGTGETLRVLASLGTGLESPGTNVYVGGGVLLFDSLIVTAGVVSGNTIEGGNEIVEEVFGGGGTRELFGTISTEREWQPYVGIFFKVY